MVSFKTFIIFDLIETIQLDFYVSRNLVSNKIQLQLCIANDNLLGVFINTVLKVMVNKLFTFFMGAFTFLQLSSTIKVTKK